MARPDYGDVGATGEVELPARYRHDRYEAVVGHGDASFGRAVEGLRAWRAHSGAGVQVFPGDARVEVGETVVLVLRVGTLWALAPCRVVYVIEEHDRVGFAYGTLPGHPEQGEEAFVVDRDRMGVVSFRITAFSRPSELSARAAAPVGRVIQRRVTLRYLDSMKDWVGRSA